MSSKKQVIHVQDLVIKADNVIIEPRRRHHARDPFFGTPLNRHRPDEESREHDKKHDKK